MSFLFHVTVFPGSLENLSGGIFLVHHRNFSLKHHERFNTSNERCNIVVHEIIDNNKNNTYSKCVFDTCLFIGPSLIFVGFHHVLCAVNGFHLIALM